MDNGQTVVAIVSILVVIGMTFAGIPSAGYCGPVPGGCDDGGSTIEEPKRDPKEKPDATPGGRHDPR